MLSDMFGAHHFPGRTWKPQIVLSGENVGSVPPGEYMVDPYLMGLGTDPFDPAGVIVLPAGRFVSIGNATAVNGGSNAYRIGINATGKTPLTLHDGKNLTPCGFSVNQMYRDAPQNAYMTDSNNTKFRRGFLAEVPFITAVNNAHGTLVAGDRVTGYWGSTSSTTVQSNLHKGKPVKWNARTTYIASVTASTMVGLSSAIYPGITPTVYLATISSGATVATTATLAYNSNFGMWFATFNNSVDTVYYRFGQDSDQIGGEVFRIQSASDLLTTDNFMRWVEYAPSDQLNFPPAAERHAVTTVGSGSDPVSGASWETPSTVTANVAYRFLNYPISVHHNVSIAIQGTIVDAQGNTSTYSGSGASDWFLLPTTGLRDIRGSFVGLYHTVNWLTGLIQLSTNITSVTGIKVSYSYITNKRDGAVLWGGGQLNLTDGAYVSVNSAPAYGLPAHLNVADAVGALRVFVY